MNLLSLPIILPIAAALLVLAFDRINRFREAASVAASLVCCIIAAALFNEKFSAAIPWAGFGFDFALRIYPFGAFVLCAICGFALLISLYSSVFMKDKPWAKWYYFNYLITLGLANGAVLADNLVLLLFFWEGLLISLYVFLALARQNQECKATAMKAFLINGAADLCLVAGVGMTAWLAGTTSMSAISASPLPLEGWGIAAYILMMIGAIAKAGSMPFHTWIPDAATDSQLPFMAYLPAALEKVLGIYLLARLSLDIFALNSSHGVQILLMTIGAVTILLAVMMALVQSDYKRLLSYHAISQVGYMILGIGTGTPVGIAGGVFHMINHAVYKSCLFLTGGSVERSAKTTALSDLGGLARNMPVTAACFAVAAASISGIPPFNGYFSKELIYRGALESGNTLFFIAAELGSVLTLASFLKLGHSVYFGRRPKELEQTKESPWQMSVPMLALAAICVIFGFGAKLPLTRIIGPALAGTFAQNEAPLWGFHFDDLFLAACVVMALAGLNHYYGLKRGGKPQKVSDHISHAPVLEKIYSLAAKRFFDPYEYGLRFSFFLARGLFVLDRVFDFFTDTLPSALTGFAAAAVSKSHNGFYPLYFGWALLGFAVFALIVSYSGAMP